MTDKKYEPQYLEKMLVDKLYKNWFFHNTIGHPLMGVLQLIGFKELAEYVHDVTLPKGSKEE